MIYPEDFETVIGFHTIRQLLASNCRYESAAERASNFQVFTKVSDIELSYNQMDEWSLLIQLHPSMADWSSTKDISAWIPSLDVENFFFEEAELLVIYFVAESYHKLAALLDKKNAEFPLLKAICGSSGNTRAIMEAVRGVIDLKGELLPNASVDYAKISKEIDSLEKDTRQVVRNIYRQWRDAGYTAETDISIRDERLVIPVLAEYKRKVNGFVKDISASGRIIYIEPVESLEMNNRLKEAFADLRREREKILRSTVAKIKPNSDILRNAMTSLIEIDFIAARVQLANKLKSNRPQMIATQQIDLRNAINPILWLRNKTDKKETVPLFLKLDGRDSLMVISGPNAGGKSIALKTTILVQYMAQCGLFINASEESKLGVFENFAIDCGDGQSIEDGLSTFSAHLKHLKKMTAISGKKTLLGIDELGDGTDPRFGGPIAQAILEYLLKTGSFGIVTTHFSRLKEWAGKQEGVINASMAFDTKLLQPLYRLVSGKPGSSFALELLRKTGFDSTMLERVESLAGEESGKTEDLLIDLEIRQKDLEDLVKSNLKKQEQLEHLIAEYSLLKTKLSDKKTEITEKARQRAKQLLDEANRQIELTIRTIREHGADKVKTQKSRQNLTEFAKKKIIQPNEKALSEKPKEVLQAPLPKLPQKWLPGMQVRSVSAPTDGEVIEVKKDKLLVGFGLLKMWVPIAELEWLGSEKVQHKKSLTRGYDLLARQSDFVSELDLRGLRTDEALSKVQKWLDEAYALGQNNLRIIHGRGDGILRKELRTFFKSLRYIKTWRSEHAEQGGDGCTVVELL